MKRLKIGYFADGPWSHNALDKLLADVAIEIAFICAREDSPDIVLKGKAKENNIEFIAHPKINSDEFFYRMEKYECDLFVSMSFNQIFKNKLINLPRLKTINCHAGKLPYYRGRNILNWALINDEKEFGITVHYVDEGIDTGNIIIQNNYVITDKDNYASLLERSYTACADSLYDAIKMIQNNTVKTVLQKNIHELGFYCTARKEGDEILDWMQSSRDIFNFIRAICRPGPEARVFLGEKEIKINKVIYMHEAPKFKGIPGAVIGVDSEGFIVKTIDSYVKVVEWSGYDSPRIGDRFK